MPAPIRYCTVLSTISISTRPDKYKYDRSKSPWRFSSAVQPRVHKAHELDPAPVSSLTPSKVLIMVWYVGNASSVIISPTSTTKKSSGSSAVRSRRARTCSVNSSEGRLGSGKRSWGCQLSLMGLRSGRTHCDAQPSRERNTSTWWGRMEGLVVWEGFRGGDTVATAWTVKEGGGDRRVWPRGVHARVWEHM